MKSNVLEAETVGQLNVLYDGDIFCLEDLATLAASRNIVKASVAGCPELVQPISQGLLLANCFFPPISSVPKSQFNRNISKRSDHDQNSSDDCSVSQKARQKRGPN